ncbi:hypothetical protein CVT24_006192 [Panaeolus cyanescens]|uniref:Carbonic anhydrase n=1 Tax=Panaeolus cyanescens TaxID=181874 RepID=A0A409V8Q1_9AGAR|nr:hypothetical protein CVT24_006192 [Panaeolus cyanescens]
MLCLHVYLFTLLSFAFAIPITISDPQPSNSSLTINPLTTETIATSTSTSSIASLQPLFEGNKQFMSKTRLEAERDAQQDSSYMFMGCLDNRLSPHTIFSAPPATLVTHNNLGNQYDDDDTNADSAITYAIEMANVDHIVVLGHYGCKSVETAITQSDDASDQVKAWVKPIRQLYKDSKRQEIVKLRDSRMPQRGHPNGITAAPPASDPGFRALVEENVKMSVKALKDDSILDWAYSRKKKHDNKIQPDVFVHGFVYDDMTGEVYDLHVSFGPPGKPIPHIPFSALAAAKNFHRDSNRPGINKGKTWNFS